MTDDQSFSKRFGHGSEEPEITIREDAPEEFRYCLLSLAVRKCSVTVRTVREIVSRILLMRPDPAKSPDYRDMWEEVEGMLCSCEWYHVYDIVEAIADHISRWDERSGKGNAAVYESAINDAMRRLSIGWQLKDGLVQARGDDAFEAAVSTAPDALKDAALPRAESELKEALHDLSRRPEADLSGAVTHAMGALECVAREVTGDPKSGFGDILRRYPDVFPKPLDAAAEKVWGYSSEQARHVREERNINWEEAQLTVGLCAVLSTYLTTKLKR